MSDTTPIKNRNINEAARRRIRDMIQYGDLGKIAARCKSVGYRRVRDVINSLERHDEVWMRALEYFNSLPEIELDDRLYTLLIENNEDKEVA